MNFELIVDMIIKIHSKVKLDELLSVPIPLEDWHSLTHEELIYISGLMDRYGMELEFEGDYVFITYDNFI